MPDTTSVYVSEDRLTVRVDTVVEAGKEREIIDFILKEGEELKLAPALDQKVVKSALTAALSVGSRVSGLVLAKGTPPIPPVEGTINWERDFFSAPLVENAETGRVDYRQRLDNSIVTKGNPLATVTPPKPGTPGVDVYGHPIPVAKVPAPRIRAGSGVEFDEETNMFVATQEGRLRYVKGVLSVDQTYTISGSIGLKTGHVSHPGSVDVAKDIEPDSRLEAGGTVHVSGAVEESVVTAGGDILVGHGIIGGGRAKLHARGSIEAIFAEHAELVADYDIRLRRELIHCTAHAHGKLLIPEGQIIGGVVSAIAGIDVGQAGSHGGVKTTLVTGVDPAVQQQIAKHRAAADELRDQAIDLTDKIGPYKSRQKSLTPFLREKLTALLDELGKVEDKRVQTEKEMEHLVETARELTKSEVLIRRKVYPDTHIVIGGTTLIVTSETDGPVVARLNEAGEVTLTPATRT